MPRKRGRLGQRLNGFKAEEATAALRCAAFEEAEIPDALARAGYRRSSAWRLCRPAYTSQFWGSSP